MSGWNAYRYPCRDLPNKYDNFRLWYRSLLTIPLNAADENRAMRIPQSPWEWATLSIELMGHWAFLHWLRTLPVREFETFERNSVTSHYIQNGWKFFTCCSRFRFCFTELFLRNIEIQIAEYCFLTPRKGICQVWRKSEGTERKIAFNICHKRQCHLQSQLMKHHKSMKVLFSFFTLCPIMPVATKEVNETQFAPHIDVHA